MEYAFHDVIDNSIDLNGCDFAPRLDKYGPSTARLSTGKSVGQHVAHHPGTSQLQTHFTGRAQKHAWLRLSVRMLGQGAGVLYRHYRAEIHAIQFGATVSQLPDKLLVHLLKSLGRQQAATDCRLVRDEDARIARFPQQAYGVSGARNELHMSRIT